MASKVIQVEEEKNSLALNIRNTSESDSKKLAFVDGPKSGTLRCTDTIFGGPQISLEILVGKIRTHVIKTDMVRTYVIGAKSNGMTVLGQSKGGDCSSDRTFVPRLFQIDSHKGCLNFIAELKVAMADRQDTRLSINGDVITITPNYSQLKKAYLDQVASGRASVDNCPEVEVQVLVPSINAFNPTEVAR